ncbi:cation:proton antiporter [Pseudonocardia abyssalis]|uniref:Cation:proton antiporter n=1 Tax=Pseudonocardia abyssalis TaxID=2792008 RepID=A0ABS6USD8_9PSEU|nr:cation:proton antiporter [Pseudonocardia abyssalis]MBW0113868.1 cation:proton antiporter [Pseudonocardia abyssalis]MBW0135135.1 cation:proton antiporter [Pseudonocardia abyssalis]
MSFVLLALLVAAGLAGPALAGLPRVGLPLVVGEIAAGVLLGRTGLGIVDPAEPTTAFLSEVGFAMLMFVLGTHLPLRDAGLRRALRPAALGTLLMLALAVPAGFALTSVGPDRPLVLAVVVATSSAAVALPILRSRAGQPPTTAFAVTWIALTDVVTVLAVPVVLATGSLGSVLLGGGLVLLAGGAVFLALRWWRRTARGHALRRRSKRRGWALDLRLGLAVLFALAALATAFGTSILIAGFTAGVVLAATGEPHRLAQQLVGIAEGFLVPLFFVTLGARLEFRALFGSGRALLLAAGLVAAAVLLHVLVAVLLRRPAAVGLLATAALGVPSAVVSIGLTQGVLDPAQAAAIITAALVSIAVSTAGGTLLARRETGDLPVDPVRP